MEQARVEEERKRAAEEKARLEQQERERLAAAEKARLEQQERERLVAAEQARVEEERKRAAEEKARLEQQEQERLAAAEKARLKQEEQERLVAAQQARLEEERRQAAEQARVEKERKQAAAEKARLEQEEQERLVAAKKAQLEQEKEGHERDRSAGVSPPGLPISPPGPRKVAIAICGILIAALVVYWVTRPKQQEPARKASQGFNSQASSPPVTKGTSSTKPPSESQNSEAKIETPKSSTKVTSTKPVAKKSDTVGMPKESYRSQPKPTLPDPKVSQQVAADITEGDWHKGRGEYQEAIKAYQKGLALDPSNAELQRKIREARSAQQTEDQILGKKSAGQ